jgi:hypothetical protein
MRAQVLFSKTSKSSAWPTSKIWQSTLISRLVIRSKLLVASWVIRVCERGESISRLFLASHLCVRPRSASSSFRRQRTSRVAICTPVLR